MGGSVEIPPFTAYRNASPPAIVELMTANTMLAQLEPIGSASPWFHVAN